MNCIAIDSILIGERSCPDLRLVKVHRVPTDSAKWFDYLADVLVKIAVGKVQPKFAAVLRSDKDRIAPSKLPSIDPENPPMAFDLSRWSFIRGGPDQSERDLNKSIDTLRRTIEARQDTNLLR